jgi:hypothetical protein
MRNKIVQALDAKFRADMMDAIAKLEVYLENSVGVGDHPNVIEEAAKQIERITAANENVRYCQNLYDKEEDMVNTDDLRETVHTLVEKMDKLMEGLVDGESK